MSTELTCACCGNPIIGYVCTYFNDKGNSASLCFQCTGAFLLSVVNGQHADMAISKEVTG